MTTKSEIMEKLKKELEEMKREEMYIYIYPEEILEQFITDVENLSPEKMIKEFKDIERDLQNFFTKIQTLLQ